MPSRRRLSVMERIVGSGRSENLIRSLPLSLAPNALDTASFSLGKLINNDDDDDNDDGPFIVPSSQTKKLDI